MDRGVDFSKGDNFRSHKVAFEYLTNWRLLFGVLYAGGDKCYQDRIISLAKKAKRFVSWVFYRQDCCILVNEELLCMIECAASKYNWSGKKTQHLF